MFVVNIYPFMTSRLERTVKLRGFSQSVTVTLYRGCTYDTARFVLNTADHAPLRGGRIEDDGVPALHQRCSGPQSL